ncbi:MAG: SAM-dependent chlorinase/fluorinase [Deltaproteobacteria bacterium]|nr:SAM-dependent chlorinase/fluorinase [Deltaproteobacteria bacterium]
MPRIITLTTDFGLEDEYVGVMKGVILARAPRATIVDLSHGIARHNVRQAALLVKAAYAFFPAGTIHLAVVDPGVGSGRRLVLLQADDHLFLGPDNGVFGEFLVPELFQAAYEVCCPNHYLQPVSFTFHGRDILAPVAARLAAGMVPDETGPAVPCQALQKPALAEPVHDPAQATITGEITGRDHFGNLPTNIPAALLASFCSGREAEIKITVNGRVIHGIAASYGARKEGDLLAIVGSRGVLEISVREGSGAFRLGARAGDAVIVEKKGAKKPG